MKNLYIDFETRSALDLRDGHSAYEYLTHESTSLLCMAYAIDGEPVRIWTPSEPFPKEVKSFSGAVVCHNANFERYILKYKLKLNFTSYICTAAIVRSQGLPGSLDASAQAAGYPEGKDSVGRKAMLKLCKPRKNKKGESGVNFHNDPEDFADLYRYCKIDVELSRKHFLNFGGLSESEQKAFELDTKMNDRGVQIDTKRAARLLNLVENSKAQALETAALNGLENLKSNQQLIAWAAARGVDLENCQADYLKDFVDHDSIGSMVRLKLLVGKTSTSKLNKILLRTGADSRCRDNLLFFGAHTGRWSGAGIQPQNFPRGTVKNFEKILKLPDSAIEMIYDDILPAVCSSALRSCIISKPKHLLFAGDFSAIEARVLFWFAGERRALDMYRKGIDIYIDMANTIYKRNDLTKADALERDMGKRVILGAGFGMGAAKFRMTCGGYGVEISEAKAQDIIDIYRNKYSGVKNFWYTMDDQVLKAVKNPGRVFASHGVKFKVKKGSLLCRLPSGRVLRYAQASTTQARTPWGEMKERVVYLSRNPQTHQHNLAPTYGGKIVENIIQAAARDIMLNSMFNLEAEGFRIVLTIHDEIVCENLRGASLPEFTKIMSQAPDWLDGCPIDVESWKGSRYKK